MATMKSLNLISSEQLNTSIEVKTPALTEIDGQAFAQTLRQQMQQDTNTQAYRQTEDQKTQNNLETQSRLSQQQTERARLAMQNNQVKPVQATKAEQLTKVAQAVAPAQTKATQANPNAKETVSHKAQNDQTDLTAQSALTDETAVALTDPLQTSAETTEIAQTDDTVVEQDAKQAGMDENAIANMGWLASMMAMRDNQVMTKAISTNKPETTDVENTIASSVLSSDNKLLMKQMAQIETSPKEGLTEESLDKQLMSTEQESFALDLNDNATNMIEGSRLGELTDSAQGLTSFSFKERLGDQPLNIDSLKATKLEDMATDDLATDNMQSVLNAQATTAINTANALTQSSQAMVSQVNVPFGIKGWQEAMNNQVMQMTQQGNELATLTLSPPDLGPVQVVLRVDNQSVDAAFVSDNANVRQALEDGLQDLKERMSSQGLQLGNTFVGNGNQAQQHFGEQANQSRAGLSQSSANSQTSMNNELETSATPVRVSPLGLVDTFV